MEARVEVRKRYYHAELTKPADETPVYKTQTIAVRVEADGKPLTLQDGWCTSVQEAWLEAQQFVLYPLSPRTVPQP
jgi:hypothetical protein